MVPDVKTRVEKLKTEAKVLYGGGGKTCRLPAPFYRSGRFANI
ncbi:protein of unknown function [Burkholderia multivorans]